jgi:hypothetical protein
MQTAVGLNTDFQRGLVDRFRSLPIARSSVVAGRIVADVLRTGWGTIITVAGGMAFGFRPHDSVAGAIAAFGLILAWGFALSWLMAFLGVSLRSPETVQTVVMPLGFASSIFAPASTMPGWLQAFVKGEPGDRCHRRGTRPDGGRPGRGRCWSLDPRRPPLPRPRLAPRRGVRRTGQLLRRTGLALSALTGWPGIKGRGMPCIEEGLFDRVRGEGAGGGVGGRGFLVAAEAA